MNKKMIFFSVEKQEMVIELIIIITVFSIGYIAVKESGKSLDSFRR
jgi:hypothetical protein